MDRCMNISKIPSEVKCVKIIGSEKRLREFREAESVSASRLSAK